jgi:thioredoxin-like negative regulator of GroEL
MVTTSSSCSIRRQQLPDRASRQTRSFAITSLGHPFNVTTARNSTGGGRTTRGDLPTLVFAASRHCGQSRRMESLVAWVKVTRKKHLRVVELDPDREPEVARCLGVRKTPTLVLLREGAIVGQIEGRATGKQIESLIQPHLPG